METIKHEREVRAVGRTLGLKPSNLLCYFCKDQVFSVNRNGRKAGLRPGQECAAATGVRLRSYVK